MSGCSVGATSVGPQPPSTRSYTSVKAPTPCRFGLEVSAVPAWSRSVGSPLSRKEGRTSPRSSSSRTAVEPCELKSPHTTHGALGSCPFGSAFARCLRTRSSASCTCESRRRASCPAVRWQLTTKSGGVPRGEPSSPRRCSVVMSVRSPCVTATPRVAGRAAHSHSSASAAPPPSWPAAAGPSASVVVSCGGVSGGGGAGAPAASQSAKRDVFHSVAGRIRPFPSSEAAYPARCRNEKSDSNDAAQHSCRQMMSASAISSSSSSRRLRALHVVSAAATDGG
mmetsp:Transcript_47714/g.153431  ORF Transcript_47714/g.153431 Transcript_47714/m.153431 type:complete len:281 (+) Transcript_47714:534-1376(+)